MEKSQEIIELENQIKVFQDKLNILKPKRKFVKNWNLSQKVCDLTIINNFPKQCHILWQNLLALSVTKKSVTLSDITFDNLETKQNPGLIFKYYVRQLEKSGILIPA